MIPCPHCSEMMPASALFCPHCHLAVRQKRLSKVITRLLSRPHRTIAPLDAAVPPTLPVTTPAQPAPMPLPHGQLTKQLQGSIQQFLRQERVITMATYTLIPVILLALTLIFGLGYLRTATHAARSATATITASGASGATATPAPATLAPVIDTTTPTAEASPSATVAPTATPKKTPTHAPATPTPVATVAPQVVLAIDTGGSGGGIYQADMDLSSGSSSTAMTNHLIDTSLTGNATPASIYQTARVGASFTYTIGQLTPGAHYTVRLDFAEISVAAAGQRQFNVAINSQPVLTNFDIVAQAGAAYKAIAKAFATTATASGQITITFTQGTANVALVSGIEIVTATSGA